MTRGIEKIGIIKILGALEHQKKKWLQFAVFCVSLGS